MPEYKKYEMTELKIAMLQGKVFVNSSGHWIYYCEIKQDFMFYDSKYTGDEKIDGAWDCMWKECKRQPILD